MSLKRSNSKHLWQSGFLIQWRQAGNDYMCHTNHMACCSLDGCHGLCIWKAARLFIMSEITMQLTSVTFSLSSSHSLFLSLSLAHSLFFLPNCPHVQSISTTYLSHHSDCSLRHSSSFHSSVGEWKGWGGWKWGGGEEGGDDLFVLEDSCVLKGAASAAETFPVTCIQLILWNDCPFSRSAVTIPPRLQIGRWEFDVMEERTVWKLPDITCSHHPACFIHFHPLPSHIRQCQPYCQTHRHHNHHYLNKCHSNSLTSDLITCCTVSILWI